MCAAHGDYGLHEIVSKDKFLIGWDYNHCHDYSGMSNSLFMDNSGKMWTTEEILEEVKYVINQLIEKEDKQ